MKIKISHALTLTQPPGPLVQKVRETFTFENPVWLNNEKMGRWNGNAPRWLACHERDGDCLLVPRGALGLILRFCKELNIRYELEDNRRILPQVDFTFNGTLKIYQEQAVNDILSRDFDVLQAPTGSGKTVMALAAIAERKQPGLIVVHSKELLNQWIARAETFLGIPKAEIGIIGNCKHRIGRKITVGIINSIYPIADDLKQYFGHIIVDECHRTPSRTFTEAVSAFDCKYMLGLSATPYRRDGLTKLIGWYLGRKVEVRQSDLSENDIILDVEVVTKATNFIPRSDPSREYTQMLSELTGDRSRNRLIANAVIKEVSNGGGTCLVLSDRKSHCEDIRSLLTSVNIQADVMTGDMGNREREDVVRRLNNGEIKTLIATGQLIGEGFDCPRLSTLFLATPIKFSGRLIQYFGRILRLAPGKEKAKIYDFVDVNVGVLRASAQQRQRVYQQYKTN